MRVILIGAKGTIGSEVWKLLKEEHELITASRNSGDFRVDISDPASIEALYRNVGSFDAVVSAAGSARFGKLDELSEDDYIFSLGNKLMGQVNLVRLGCHVINDSGSFTLTSGVLSMKPMRGSSAISMVNAGLEGFVRAAALELERGVRVNVVSPVWVKETLEAMGKDGSKGLSAEWTSRAYAAAVNGGMSGEVLDVWDYI
jgi:NAD(P)-dependent dehydrogenase (short-subunit alcohol dehydrogenase family)